MIVLEVKCIDHDSMIKKREEFHKALVGSPGYIDSEIAVCDESDNSFVLIVGKNNEDNIHYIVTANRLMKPKKE